jgi:hypothetical protein
MWSILGDYLQAGYPTPGDEAQVSVKEVTHDVVSSTTSR